MIGYRASEHRRAGIIAAQMAAQNDAIRRDAAMAETILARIEAGAHTANPVQIAPEELALIADALRSEYGL